MKPLTITTLFLLISLVGMGQKKDTQRWELVGTTTVTRCQKKKVDSALILTTKIDSLDFELVKIRQTLQFEIDLLNLKLPVDTLRIKLLRKIIAKIDKHFEK